MTLKAEDCELLSHVEESMRSGKELYKWWRLRDRDEWIRSVDDLIHDLEHRGLKMEDGEYEEACRYLLPFFNLVKNARDDHFSDVRPVVRQLRTREKFKEKVKGFLGDAALETGMLPVLGVIQEMPIDNPLMGAPDYGKPESVLFVFRQLKEFVDKYFLRTSGQPLPRRVAKLKPRPNRFQFNWQPNTEMRRAGFGHSQYAYQKKGSRACLFPEAKRRDILPLKDIKENFDWLILKSTLFDFKVTVPVERFSFDLPVLQEIYTIVAPKTIKMPSEDDVARKLNEILEIAKRRDRPHREPIAELGYVYYWLPDKTSSSIFAYGPSRLTTACGSFSFKLLSNGEIWMKMTWVTNRPARLVAFTPAEWGAELANMMTLGMAKPLISGIGKTVEKMTPNFAPIFDFTGIADVLTAGWTSRHLGMSPESILGLILGAHYLVARGTLVESSSNWKLVNKWTDKENLPPWVNRN